MLSIFAPDSFYLDVCSFTHYMYKLTVVSLASL